MFGWVWAELASLGCRGRCRIHNMVKSHKAVERVSWRKCRRAESFNCKRIPHDMGQSLQDPGICVLSIHPARTKFGGGKITYFRGFGLNIRVKESKIEGWTGFLAKFDPQSSLLVLFSFVLANKSTPLLLLSTFGSAFVRKCEQKQSTLINLLTISCWFCFRLHLRTKALHSHYYYLLWLCFRSWVQTKAIHSDY